ncbi:MAG: cupin domain-containing protein [Candidatus Binatia bacterium]
MSKPAITNQIDRDRLHEKFAQLSLRGYWQLERGDQRMEPKLWRWADLYPVLMETTEVIRIGPDAFRRNVGLQTGSRTVSFGFQIVLPGEKAAAHRHTNSALRFVVSGGGAYTTSDNEPMFMQPGDLLIQPNFAWHGHVNDSKEPIIWIDALDSGLVNFLTASFREDWSEGMQQLPAKSEGTSRRLYGSIRQPRIDPGSAVPYHYPWNETLEALQAAAEQRTDDYYDGVLLEYRNPMTGGPTFRTMTCFIQMLRPGETTKSHRHTGVTHYHVVQGSGAFIVDKDHPKEFSWGKQDSFTLPPWRWHQHRNNSATEPAILFSVTDRPLLQMTGLDREERS